MTDILDSILTGTALDTLQFDPLHWCVDGIIPEGTGLLVAPPKAGKSWLVAGIGLACAGGGVAMGSFPVEARPVLYLALEDSPRRLQDRFRRLTGGAPIPDIGILTDPDVALRVMTEYFIAHKDERPLVILDTLGKVMATPKAGTNSYATDYKELSSIMQMQQAAPCSTLLIVHHTRKQEANDFVHTASGTTGVTGAVDFVITLERNRVETEAVLNVTGRDVPEDRFAVRFDDGLWTIDHDGHKRAAEAAERQRHSERTAKVLEFVRSRAETRPSEVFEHLGIDSKRASEVLSRLADRGLIRKLGRGVYGLADCAENAESPSHQRASFPHSDPSRKQAASLGCTARTFRTIRTAAPAAPSSERCRAPRCDSMVYARGLCLDCIRQASINSLVQSANPKPIGAERVPTMSADTE